jgi:hypothetical protein
MLADSDCAIDRIHRQSGTRYCSVIVLPQLFSVWVESMNKSHSEMATYLLHNLFCVDFYIVVIPILKLMIRRAFKSLLALVETRHFSHRASAHRVASPPRDCGLHQSDKPFPLKS